VAFPHPEAGEDDGGEEDEAGGAGVLGEVFEGAVDVADDGDGEDQVEPAEEGAFGEGGHDYIPSRNAIRGPKAVDSLSN